VLTGVTATAERRVLHWLARRMPARVNSDHLTGLALFAMVMAGLSYWAARWDPLWLLVVNGWLAVNWFGDSLDGTLARVRRQQRPRYGFYVDHVVDAVGIAALVGGMAASGLMHPQIALGVLVAYFLVSIEVYLATYCLGTFRISVAGVGPTELRLLLAIGNAVLFLRPDVLAFGRWPLFDLGGAVAVGGMLVVAVASMLRNGTALARLEPRPERSSS
jgi:phosphatidylglycerophosphate synthase